MSASFSFICIFIVAFACASVAVLGEDISELHAIVAVSAINAKLAPERPTQGIKHSVTPPKMLRQWRAHVNQTYLVNGEVPPPTFGFVAPLPLMASDADAKRSVTFSDMKLPFAPQKYVGTAMEWFNNTILSVANSTLFAINDNKYFASDEAPFNDIFSWLPAAKYGGHIIYGGHQLDRWTFGSQQLYTNASFELLVRSDGVPVRVTQNITVPEAVYNVTYEFSQFLPGLGQIERFWDTFNETDYITPMVCPAGASVAITNVTMWIFHAKHVMDIVGQDLGNEAGDVVFVCQDVIANQSLATDHGYEWLTQWEIELVPRWGQYQNCNGHPPECIGVENFWVGREHAEYMGLPSSERQCGVANELTGMWFSLPIGGQCKGDARPGDGTCTWRIARRVKTIEGKCLIEGHGFKHACVAEQRSPFPTATKIFKEAFASEDPEKGGCPALRVELDSDASQIIV